MRLLPRRRPTREPLIRPEDILLSKRITWRIDEPFTIFECSPLLGSAAVSALLSSFPNDVLSRGFSTGALQSRLVDHISPTQWKEFLKTNIEWQELVDAFSSRRFFRDFISVLAPAVESRARDKSHHWSWRFFRRHAWKLRINYDVNFDLNISRRGYFLSPHVDAGEKILALIVYLGEPGVERADGGTGFYRTRTDAPDAVPAGLARIVDETAVGYSASLAYRQQEQEFRAYFEKFHLSRYATGSAAGFVKSWNSLHDCDLRDWPQGEIRRVVLFNINIRPLLWRRRKTRLR